MRQKRTLGIAVHPASALCCAHSRVRPTGKSPVYYWYACFQKSWALLLSFPSLVDTKSSQGHNASRAPTIACAPNRILLHCSRRSQSSLLPLARRHSSTDAGNLPGKPNPLTLGHLTTSSHLQPDRLPLSWLKNAHMPYPMSSRRACQPSSDPYETRNQPKRRATTIVTRPGCKGKRPETPKPSPEALTT